MSPSRTAELELTPREAAFASQLPTKLINKAVDSGELGGKLGPLRRSGGRRLNERDLIFLKLVNDMPDLFRKSARRDLYRKIREMQPQATSIRMGPVTVDLREARKVIYRRLDDLERAKRLVVSCPDIRGGEPVLRGTRIPVHMIASLSKQGASDDELLEDYPALTERKLAAARTYAKAYPRRGRPRHGPWRDNPA